MALRQGRSVSIEHTFGRPPARSGTDAERLAWAAGLFDGEGSTTTSGAWDTPQLTVPQAGDTETPPETLTRFHRVVGVGAVKGPHLPKDPKWKPMWHYTATGSLVIQILERLWPYLGDVKRRQAEIALERHRTHPTPHARIAAATGRPLRQHCKYGHSLDDAYVHRGKRHCRSCRRLSHRRRRAKRSSG